jgi:hydroxyacylglutathione hydrolase
MRALSFCLLLLACCANSHKSTKIDALAVETFVRKFSNVHLVAQGENYFLVDAGYLGEAPALEESLQKEGFDPAKLKAIIITHGHADHAGGASYFQKKYNTKIIAGADQDMLSSGKNTGDLCPTNGTAKRRLEKDKSATYEPTTIDVLVEAETALAPLTGIEGKIVPLAGHTPGSLVVQVKGAVLVGDLFRGSLVGKSAQRHFYICDLEDNRADLTKVVQEIAPDADAFFVGHFGPLNRKKVQAMLDDWAKK